MVEQKALKRFWFSFLGRDIVIFIFKRSLVPPMYKLLYFASGCFVILKV